MILPPEQAEPFLADIRRNPVNAALVERLPSLDLPDCWLVAGCLFETIWNTRSGRPPTADIHDYDVFYFDRSDLTYEAEDRVIRRVLGAFADLPATIEVKNQARVHVWYRDKFDHDYPALQSSTDGIARFLVECTCVAVRCEAGLPPAVYARYGLDDLYVGILKPNAANPNARLFTAKASSYRARWPWLGIVGP